MVAPKYITSVYEEDNMLFKSYGTTAKPYLMPDHMIRCSFRWPESWKKVQMFDLRLPELCMALKHPKVAMSGLMFGRLAEENIVIKPCRRGPMGDFELDPAVQIQWQHLEDILRHFIVIILAAYKMELPMMTHCASELRLPSRYGYLNAYPAQSTTFTNARNSRDVFVPLVARIMYLLFWIEHTPHPSDGWKRFGWEAVMAEEHGLHNQWITDLKGSLWFSGKLPKVGTIFRLLDRMQKHKSDIILQLAEQCNSINMPLWFAWTMEELTALRNHPDYTKYNVLPT